MEFWVLFYGMINRIMLDNGVLAAYVHKPSEDLDMNGIIREHMIQVVQMSLDVY